MGGLRPLAWAPLTIRALKDIAATDLGVFVVLFSGEKECAEAIAAWMKEQVRPVLHVSSHEVPGAFRPEELTIEALQRHCQEVFNNSAGAFSDEQRAAAQEALSKWAELPVKPSGLTAKGHNITRPNYMALRRAARSWKDGQPFIGRSEQEYTDAILETTRAVVAVREEVGLRGFHFMTLLRPELILAEPALYRLHYKSIKPEGPFEEKLVAQSLRWIQTQKGLYSELPADYAKELQKSPTAQMLIASRASELDTFTVGIGLRAARTTSAVIRLSPGVNHVFPSLSAYARNVRSSRFEARLKTRRLFNTIQQELRTAVGDERIAFIRERGGPIKIVCDAPIELLPIGNLPLGMRYDCSRINATPGNLLMALLLEPRPGTVAPEGLQKILVMSSFAANDPLRNVLVNALEVTRDGWEKRAKITFSTARTREEFIDAINKFDGAILIFDGHGDDNSDEPVGRLRIGHDAVDVWELRGKVRMPPIAILSACDTQGIDASSHATVGNGFLALGAQTVLATLLPVGGFASASFIARLVYRIADFIPAALKLQRRSLTWMEVVSGMLRMLLASELLDSLVGPPAEEGTFRSKLQIQVNADINIEEDENWFDNLLARIAEHRQQRLAVVETKARAVLAQAEAIRYVQLGNPEMIVIDDGSPKGPGQAETGGIRAA